MEVGCLLVCRFADQGLELSQAECMDPMYRQIMEARFPSFGCPKLLQLCNALQRFATLCNAFAMLLQGGISLHAADWPHQKDHLSALVRKYKWQVMLRYCERRAILLGNVSRFPSGFFPGFCLTCLLSFLAFWLSAFSASPVSPQHHASHVSVDGAAAPPPPPPRQPTRLLCRAVVWFCDDRKRQN